MDDIARLERLRDELGRLKGVAREAGLSTLTYLLDMAFLEAKAAVAARIPTAKNGPCARVPPPER